MKKTKLKTLLFSYLLLLSFSLQAQDIWTHYYKGDYVNGLLETTTDIWIATTVGLIKIDKATEQQEVLNVFNSDLINHNIRSIIQDHDGLIWIKTKNGISNFDGFNWVHHTPENTILDYDDTGIPNTDQLYVDGENRIWTKNNNRLIYYVNGNWTFTYETDGFSSLRFRVNPNGEAWIREINATDGYIRRFSNGSWIAEDANISSDVFPSGVFWIGVDSENNPMFSSGSPIGFLKWNLQNESWTFFPQDSTIDFYGGHRTIDHEDNIWLFNNDEQSFIKFTQPDIWEIIPIPNGIPEIFVHNMTAADDGIWFSSTSNWALDSLGKINQQNQFEWIDVPDDLYYNYHHLLELTDGSLFMGTGGQQPVLYKNNQFNVIDIASADLASDYTIDIIGQDDAQQIHFNSIRENKINSFDGNDWTTIDYPFSVGGSWFEPIGVLPSGAIWFPIFNQNFQGISIYENGIWDNMNPAAASFLEQKIEEIEIAPDASIWLEVNDTNSIFQYKNNIWKEYHFPNYGLPTMPFDILGFDNEGQIWILFNYNYNMYFLNNATDSFELVLEPLEVLQNLGSMHLSKNVKMVQVENGDFYFMKHNKLIRYDGTDFLTYDTLNSPIPFGTEFYTIEKDSSGNIWLATTEGVFKFDGDATWKTFNAANSPLADNWQTDILIDHENNIWTTCWRCGIYSLTEDPNSTSTTSIQQKTDFSFSVFPNPFSSEVTFSFDLENRADVKLEIFDMTGRLISTPFFGKKSAGNHQLNLNFSKFSQGVYCCKIIVGKKEEVLKFVKI